MPDSFINHLQKIADLNEDEISTIQSLVEYKGFRRREFLLHEQKQCDKLFFVEKGCLRMYFINSKGVEQITQFALDSWWISDFQGLLNDTPSDYYIQTIEESSIVSISKQNLDLLLIKVPALEKYFRLVFTKALASAQYRSKLLYEMSKEEFYIHFSTSFPEFMQRVPQYMIASYLGLTPEYLSELRKKSV